MRAMLTRKISGIAVVLIIVISVTGGALEPAGQASAEQGKPISAGITRVVLYATVRQNNGGFVADLNREDFTILEDGKPQEIVTFQREDVPVAIGLLVDNSQSMMNKRSQVVEAARAFVRATNPQDDIFILHFNEVILWGLSPEISFTGDRRLLYEALDRMTVDGRTALYAAIAEGLKHLNKSSLTKKALIVLSDGGDNMGPLKMDDVVKLADLSGASFYAIGIYDPMDGDADPRVLRNLANRTGGEAYFPQQVDDVRSLCERIAATLRNQYALSYSPPSWATGPTYRKIELKVKDPKRRKLTVRTRTGYYTTGPNSEKQP
jgi:Ca-activated chloride channel homolog